MRSFDEKIYICDTCHKHLSRNEMSCQQVFNKMILDLISKLNLKLKKRLKQTDCVKSSPQCHNRHSIV